MKGPLLPLKDEKAALPRTLSPLDGKETSA